MCVLSAITPQVSSNEKPPRPLSGLDKSKWNKNTVKENAEVELSPLKNATAKVVNQSSEKSPQRHALQRRPRSPVSLLESDAAVEGPRTQPVSQATKIKACPKSESLLIATRVQSLRPLKKLPKSHGDYKAAVQTFLHAVENDDLELLKSFSNKSDEDENVLSSEQLSDLPSKSRWEGHDENDYRKQSHDPTSKSTKAPVRALVPTIEPRACAAKSTQMQQSSPLDPSNSSEIVSFAARRERQHVKQDHCFEGSLTSSADAPVVTSPVMDNRDFEHNRGTPEQHDSRCGSRERPRSPEQEALNRSATSQSQCKHVQDACHYRRACEPVSSMKNVSFETRFRSQTTPEKDSKTLSFGESLVGKTIEVRSASKRNSSFSMNESAGSGTWVRLLSQENAEDSDEEEDEDAFAYTARIKEEALSQRHPWRRDSIIRQVNSFDGDFSVRSSFEDGQPCQCASSVFSGRDELVEFYLPLMGMACVCGARSNSPGLRNPEEPTSLENILRPWQTEYLASFGIYRGDQLVKAYHRSGSALARALRRYRKKHGMTPFRTKSCGMALSIWAKTSKAFVRSIRKQLTTGISEGIKMPNTLYILSSFLDNIPMDGSNSLRIGMPTSFVSSEECSL
jgi:hypothetical protein